VTGAGGGIGRSIAKAFADRGATLWLVGRTAETLEQTATLCVGAEARVRTLDLTIDDQTEALAHEISSVDGRIDTLVHCAGTIGYGTVESSAVDELDRMYAANVRAFFVLAQRLLPLLRVASGQVTVVNSSVVSGPRPGVGHFAATQHALRALTDTFRAEVAADGIRVLSVFPGRTATSRQEELYRSRGEDYQADVLLQPEDVATIVATAVTLPRTAEVTEISLRPALRSYV
jgi:NADP-dependent 3-hydroxy acid dehydrogenase YdfG